MQQRQSIVLASAEAWPYAKAGGLGDVASALATALAATGCQVTLALPGYGWIDRSAFRRLEATLTIPVGRTQEPCGLLLGTLPETTVRVLLLDHPGYFHRPGIYGDPENGAEYDDAVARYVFFSRALLAALPVLGPAPDIVHLNDHHCALAAAYRATGVDATEPFLRRTALVLGIHNLGYQGVYDARFLEVTGLPAALLAPTAALEFWGRMNFLKAGVVFADVLTTVSPTYAREIQESPTLGHGLDGVLRTRHADLYGILNGIDTAVWDPQRDPLIPARYDAVNREGKAACKHALQLRSGLPPGVRLPLFGVVTRLVEQKGIDLLLDALDEILRRPVQLVVLGQGNPEYAARLRERARVYPDQLAVHVGYDDTLAHWIEAGSDFFLMPSRYEPCGLNQMYSMRYGTVPVVRATGGLADTVQDWDGHRGTGFVFHPYRPEALLGALDRAVHAYRDDLQLAALVRAGMSQDFSWRRAAEHYLRVYGTALERRLAAPTAAAATTQEAPERLGH